MQRPGEMEARPWWQDGRGWAIVAVMLAIFALEFVLPDAFLLPFICVPLVVAAMLVGPREMGAIAALGTILAVVSVLRHPTSGDANDWLWPLVTLAVGGLAVAVSSHGDREMHGRLADEQRLRAALDTEMDPHVLIVPVRDSAGRIADFVFEYANQAACTYMGTAREEFVGSRMLEVSPAAIRTGMLDRCAGAFESRVPLVLDDFGYPVEDAEARWFDIRGVCVDHALSVVWRDVTDRHHAERRLAESQARFRLLAENASDVVYQLGPDRAIAWISSSVTAALGWAPEDLVGAQTIDLIHPDDWAGSNEAREAAFAGDDVANPEGGYVSRWHTADGQYRWMSARITPTKDASGAVTGYVHGLRNVEALVRARERAEAGERELKESEARFRLLAENSSDVVMRTRDDSVVWVSPSLSRMLGWATDEWIGHSMAEFWLPEDAAIAAAAQQRIADGSSAVLRMRLRAKDGTYHWLEVHAQRYVDDDGVVDGVLSSFRTVDREVQAEAELDHRARFDDLTGLINRQESMVILAAVTGQARRSGERSAILFCDIDGFKGLNDTYGHAAGDEVLRVIASRVQSCVRAGDQAGRIGGDELLVILERVHSLDDAVRIAGKIREAVAVPVPTRAGDLDVTVSVGVTLAAGGESVDAMIARADVAMYEAKRAGRNRVIAVPLPDEQSDG